ncbi:unnamed protein product [Strongylus vulgaris]|uniref:Uncharacterized protein n=1 Tax=Strongylus vulgaris TaxID=40348 RepID=A0A3P7IR85_STRVU|nr:unnamed protein product [Strongylus vulgaris]
MQWTQGEQPWCRHRAKDNILTWLFWMAVAMGILFAIIGVFTICWGVKQADRRKRGIPQKVTGVRNHDTVPLNHYEQPRESEMGPEYSGISAEPSGREARGAGISAMEVTDRGGGISGMEVLEREPRSRTTIMRRTTWVEKLSFYESLSREKNLFFIGCFLLAYENLFIVFIL